MLSLGFEAQLQRLQDILLPPDAASAPGIITKVAKKAKKSKAGTDDVPLQLSPARPQVMLYTATMPPAVLESAGRWLSAEAFKVEVSNSASSISSGVTQIVQVRSQPQMRSSFAPGKCQCRSCLFSMFLLHARGHHHRRLELAHAICRACSCLPTRSRCVQLACFATITATLTCLCKAYDLYEAARGCSAVQQLHMHECNEK
eukprot:329107-Chlamydomonas_euryale.AAC.9